MISVPDLVKILRLSLSLVFFTHVTVQAEDTFDVDADFMSSNTKVGFSFDGGGIRGYFSLIILEEIEKRAGVPFAQCVDIMFGTSTGGIGVAALSYPDHLNPHFPKYSVSEVLDIYRLHGKDIFPPAKWGMISKISNVFGVKYSEDGLKKVANKYFGTLTLSNAITPVGIVTNNIAPDQPYVFYSDSFYKSDPEKDWYLKDVVQATSAAPTYLPVAKIYPLTLQDDIWQPSHDPHYFVDGGVSGMNNPSTRAYADMCKRIDFEIMQDFQMDNTFDLDTLKTLARTNVRFISLGTGYVETHQSYKKMKDAGVLRWLEALINLTLGMPSQTNHKEMKDFLPSYKNEKGQTINRYWRLNTKIEKNLEAMDNVSSENLQALEQIALEYIKDHDEKIEEIVKVLRTRYAYKQHQNISQFSLKSKKGGLTKAQLHEKYAYEFSKMGIKNTIFKNQK